MSLCAGSLSELCASYGMVNSACLVGSNGAGRAATNVIFMPKTSPI